MNSQNNSIDLLEKIEENPIIAAVRKSENLKEAVESDATTIFLLHADIFNAGDLVRFIKDSGKSALIHFDFIEGLGRDTKAIEYIAQNIKPDGVITTRSGNIKPLKDVGIFTVQRFFILDSQSYDTAVKAAASAGPDMIEILPGIMPKIIERMKRDISQPIIAGGLVDTKDDIMSALRAGAMGVSVGKKELWGL